MTYIDCERPNNPLSNLHCLLALKFLSAQLSGLIDQLQQFALISNSIPHLAVDCQFLMNSHNITPNSDLALLCLSRIVRKKHNLNLLLIIVSTSSVDLLEYTALLPGVPRHTLRNRAVRLPVSP